MALTKMTKRDSYVDGYEYTETIASGKTGDDIRIFPLGLDSEGIIHKIFAGSGTGYFEWTMSPDAMVVAGTANWDPWPQGTVTGTKWDRAHKITGLRGVSVSGEIKIEVGA